MFKVQWGQADSNHHDSPSRPSAYVCVCVCVCVCVGRSVSQASLYTHWAWLVRSWLRINSVRSWVILFLISSKYWLIFWRSVASCAKLPVGGFQNTHKKTQVNKVRVFFNFYTFKRNQARRWNCTMCQSEHGDGDDEGEFHGCWVE